MCAIPLLTDYGRRNCPMSKISKLLKRVKQTSEDGKKFLTNMAGNLFMVVFFLGTLVEDLDPAMASLVLGSIAAILTVYILSLVICHSIVSACNFIISHFDFPPFDIINDQTHHASRMLHKNNLDRLLSKLDGHKITDVIAEKDITVDSVLNYIIMSASVKSHVDDLLDRINKEETIGDIINKTDIGWPIDLKNNYHAFAKNFEAKLSQLKKQQSSHEVIFSQMKIMTDQFLADSVFSGQSQEFIEAFESFYKQSMTKKSFKCLELHDVAHIGCCPVTLDDFPADPILVKATRVTSDGNKSMFTTLYSKKSLMDITMRSLSCPITRQKFDHNTVYIHSGAHKDLYQSAAKFISSMSSKPMQAPTTKVNQAVRSEDLLANTGHVIEPFKEENSDREEQMQLMRYIQQTGCRS